MCAGETLERERDPCGTKQAQSRNNTVQGAVTVHRHAGPGGFIAHGIREPLGSKCGAVLAWLCSMRTRNSQHEDFDVGRWEAAFGCATERLQRVHAVPWAPQLGPDARARRGRCKSSPSVFFFFCILSEAASVSDDSLDSPGTLRSIVENKWPTPSVDMIA